MISKVNEEKHGVTSPSLCSTGTGLKQRNLTSMNKSSRGEPPDRFITSGTAAAKAGRGCDVCWAAVREVVLPPVWRRPVVTI